MFKCQPGKEHLGCSIHKKYGLKISKYKADTFDMIQHALEENNMVKAIQSTRTFVGLKKKNVMCEQMCEQEKSTKTPKQSTQLKVFQTKIARLLIWRLLMSLTTAMVLNTKICSKIWKNVKDLNNICSKEVLGKNINLFVEMLITVKDPFYNKGSPSFDFLMLLKF